MAYPAEGGLLLAPAALDPSVVDKLLAVPHTLTFDLLSAFNALDDPAISGS